MKVVLFFSRVAFICNIAFLLFVFFRWLELKKTHETSEVLIPVPFLKNLIITLGVTAIVINIILNVIYLVQLISGRHKNLYSWLVITNFLFLILQVYYFFFY